MRKPKNTAKNSKSTKGKPTGSRTNKAKPTAANGRISNHPGQYTVGDRVIKIDPEFAKVLLPLTTEEKTQLDLNISAAGRSRERLVIWKGHDILVDGHTRLPLFLHHKIEVEFEEIDFADRQEVQNWIYDLHRGRRSLSGHQESYIRGKRYEAAKQSHGGKRGKRASSAQREHMHPKTAEALAKKFHVSSATIRRDAEFARDVDVFVKNCGQEAREVFLAKDCKLTQKEIKEGASWKAADQKALFEGLQAGKSYAEVQTALGKIPPPSSKGPGPVATHSHNENTEDLPRGDPFDDYDSNLAAPPGSRDTDSQSDGASAPSLSVDTETDDSEGDGHQPAPPTYDDVHAALSGAANVLKRNLPIVEGLAPGLDKEAKGKLENHLESIGKVIQKMKEALSDDRQST